MKAWQCVHVWTGAVQPHAGEGMQRENEHRSTLSRLTRYTRDRSGGERARSHALARYGSLR